MGDSGGAKTKSTSTNQQTATVELPTWYSAKLEDLANRGQAVWNSRWYEQYPSMYVGMDPATTRGLGMVEGVAGARGGSAVPRAALSEWQKTVGGEYLNPDTNPWLRDVADRAGYEAEQRINSQYARGGASGGGVYANALADAQTQMRSQLYADNFQAERQRMQAALGLAPTMENLQYADAARLGMVGLRREEDALSKATEANRQYMKPWDESQRYADLLYGNPAQRAITATETGKVDSKSDTNNRFDWAAFVGGLLG